MNLIKSIWTSYRPGKFYFLSKVLFCLVAQSCPTLWDPMDCSLPGSCPWQFSRQEYWSGLPCPPPGNLPNPGIEPRSPTLQTDSLPSEPPGKPSKHQTQWTNIKCKEPGKHQALNICSLCLMNEYPWASHKVTCSSSSSDHLCLLPPHPFLPGFPVPPLSGWDHDTLLATSQTVF